MSETLKILKKARELLLQRGWTQGFMVRRADTPRSRNCFSDLVGPDGTISPLLEGCCMGGAIGVAGLSVARTDEIWTDGRAESEAEKIIRTELPGGHDSIVNFNDHLGQTKEEVVAVFDRAIAKLEAADA